LTETRQTVLLLAARLYPEGGGIERSIHHMASELAALGHRAIVAVLIDREEVPGPHPHPAGYEVCRFRGRRGRVPYYLNVLQREKARRDVASLLEAFTPDAVWVRHANLAAAAKRAGCVDRLIYMAPTAQGFVHVPNSADLGNMGYGFPSAQILAAYAWLHHVFWRRCEREVVRAGVRVVTFSENVRGGLLCAGANASQVQVIPPGVDTEEFAPVDGPEAEIAATALGLQRNDRIVVYVGRLLPDKNLELLLEAFALVDDKGARLLIVGDGALRAHLGRRTEELGIAERVIFAGRVADGLARTLSLGRVCVLPTTVEGFGLSFLESLACGVPCVGFSSALPGTHTATEEIVEDARTGRIAREAGAQGLADAIGWVLSRSEVEWHEMSVQSRRDAETRFRWRRFAVEALALCAPKRLHGGMGRSQ
jgi:glycosyltransferase involved in cell wall biosynthesis